jgi:hypothetical protein
MPASLYQFELDVFENCLHLREFSLPKDSKLENLCKGAFQGSGVRRLVMPGMRNLADEAFVGCKDLRAVKFAVPGQTKEQRSREMRLPAKLFDDVDVYVIYPEGTLKKARANLRESLDEDFI